MINKLLFYIAPGLGLKRLHKQMALKHYIAASQRGPNRTWRPTDEKEFEILQKDKKMMIARCRDLVRNSSHISGAVDKIVDNAIFTGIHPQVIDKNIEEDLELKWEKWATATNFYEIQRLVARHLIVDGECLVVDSVDPDLRKRDICPLFLEVLEFDRLDTSKDSEDGKIIRNGIELDRYGRPSAAWILDESGDISKRYTADRFLHIYEKKRASQFSGLPKFASIVMEMRDYSEYQSSERIAARLASAFGVFIESPYAEHQAINPLSGVENDGAVDVPTYLESGRIDVLPPGMKVSVAENKRPGSNYESFSKMLLKQASSGTGLSYEVFSNDYSDATYSSARSASLQERKAFQVFQFLLNSKLNNHIWHKFCYALSTSGMGNYTEIPTVKWQNPGWSWVDPLKDARAAEVELSLGITTRRKLAAERGEDWDNILRTLKEEQEMMKEAGLLNSFITKIEEVEEEQQDG